MEEPFAFLETTFVICWVLDSSYDEPVRQHRLLTRVVFQLLFLHLFQTCSPGCCRTSGKHPDFTHYQLHMFGTLDVFSPLIVLPSVAVGTPTATIARSTSTQP